MFTVETQFGIQCLRRKLLLVTEVVANAERETCRVHGLAGTLTAALSDPQRLSSARIVPPHKLERIFCIIDRPLIGRLISEWSRCMTTVWGHGLLRNGPDSISSTSTRA